MIPLIKTECRRGVPGAEGQGNGDLLLVDTKEFWICKMRRILWMDGGGGHTMMQVYLKLLNYTPKNS